MNYRTVNEWVNKIDKDTKAARNDKIFEMWMRCHTQEEIGEAVGCPQQTVKDILPKMEDLHFSVKSSRAQAEHAVDYTQEEIAEAVGCSVHPVKDITDEKEVLQNRPRSDRALADHLPGPKIGKK